MRRKKPIFTVTADADDLPGWTAQSLANALVTPLAELRVRVQCRTLRSGGGGLSGYADAELQARVKQIVDEVIERGPQR